MPTLFPSVELHGFDCLLVLPRISWNRRPRITPTIANDTAEGRTGIEGVAAGHDDVRLSLEYHYILEPAAAAELEELLRDLDPDARLLLPLWPEIAPAADYAAQRVWTAQHWLNVDVDSGAYAIDEDAGHPESVGLVMCAPLELPRRRLISDTEAEIILKAEEDSPWEARVEIHTLEQAAWTWEPDFASAPETTTHWQQQRRRMGHGRVTARTGQDAPTKRHQAAQFTFTSREELRRALTFWTSKLGPRDPFTVPVFLRPLWDGTPGNAPIMQARFAEETFPIEFAPPTAPYGVESRTRLSFAQQLLLAPGAPSQSRPSRAFLLKLWWDGSANVMAWTDWVRDYTHAGIVYTPRPLELKDMVETLRIGDTEWRLLITDFDGNPLRAFGRLARERRLMAEIRECDPAIADTAALVFRGEVKKAPNKGPIYTASLALFGGVLKYLIPACTVQNGCNNTFGDDLCGVNPEDHKAIGTIAAVDGTVIDITTVDGGAADAWALGYALFGAGDDQEVRFILKSTPITGGQRVTLHRALWSAGVGAAVVMYPGCDQQFFSGCARWGNQERFFGAPHRPPYIETVSNGFKAKTGK